jgi:hypothetical protein
MKSSEATSDVDMEQKSNVLEAFSLSLSLSLCHQGMISHHSLPDDGMFQRPSQCPSSVGNVMSCLTSASDCCNSFPEKILHRSVTMKTSGV